MQPAMLSNKFFVEMDYFALLKPDDGQRRLLGEFAECVTETTTALFECLQLRLKLLVKWRQFDPFVRLRQRELIANIYMKAANFFVGKNESQRISNFPELDDGNHCKILLRAPIITYVITFWKLRKVIRIRWFRTDRM